MIRSNMSALLLNCTLALCFVTSAIAQSPNLHKDAVAIWDFSQGKGRTLRDVSGNGHHGTIHGAKWVTGSWGHALAFDRDNRNFVSVPDSPKLHLQPPYTIGVWFRTTSSQNNTVYLLKNGGTFTGCGLYYYGDSQALYVDAKGVDQKLYHKGSSSKSLPDGTWHHVVGTCGNGRQQLFLDGRIFAERDIPKNLKLNYSGTKGIQLGHWLGNGYFAGTMGKAFLLRRALTAKEVQALSAYERKKRFNNNVTIRTAASAAKIDGRLDDVCWRDGRALNPFMRIDYDSTEPKAKTTAHISFDANHLYVAAKCDVRDISSVIAKERSRDDRRSMDDERLEFFVSTSNKAYYHFVVTAANALLDRKCDYEIGRRGYAPGGFARFSADRSWNCVGIKTAVQKGPKSWTVEMAIPLSQLGGANSKTSLRLNIARWDSHGKELSTFSPLFQRLDQPQTFSSLTFRGDTAIVKRAAKKYVSIDLTPRGKTNDSIKSDGKPIVFATHYLQRGSYTTLPAKSDRTNTIELFASLGEFEPATFSVRATDRELHDVRAVVAGDLMNDRGDVIAASNVGIRVVELWRRQMDSRRHMFMERFLERQTSLDIAPHTTRRFWLTIHVPERAKKGIYRTSIRVRAGKATIQSLNLRVEVLPIRLKKAAGMGYFMYLPTWGIPPKLRTKEYLKRIFVDMRRHGMTTATLYPYGLPFESVMDVLRDSKLMVPGVPAIWLGADSVSPKRWKEVLDEGKKQKWPELALYLQDEPGDQQRVNNAKRLFRLLEQFKKQHPEHRSVRATTAIGSSGIKALGQQYDIWIAGAGFKKDLVKKSQRMDKLLWSYDCNLAPVDAESCRHYFGMWCWKTQIKGSAVWAYADPGSTGPDAWVDILKNLTTTELHYSFVRPTPEDLVPTIGWEAVREGVDDYRYLTTLTLLIKRAKAASRKIDVKQATGLLKELDSRIDVNGYQKGIQGGLDTKLRMGNHYDRTSPQSRLAKQDYDRFRRRMADEILRLQRSLAD